VAQDMKKWRVPVNTVNKLVAVEDAWHLFDKLRTHCGHFCVCFINVNSYSSTDER
jgi:hypothetical protein